MKKKSDDKKVLSGAECVWDKHRREVLKKYGFIDEENKDDE